MTNLRTLKRPTAAFNAKTYAWQAAHGATTISNVFSTPTAVATPPATLADHEAAEIAARDLFNERLKSGPDYDELPEISELDGDADCEAADNIRDWANDILSELQGWQNVAQALFAFRAKERADA